MEMEMESKNEDLKSQIPNRYAQSSLLLSSLRSFQNRYLNSPNFNDEERETLMNEVMDLKIQLVRVRMKNKRIKLCSLMEFILQILVLLSVFTFILVLVN